MRIENYVPQMHRSDVLRLLERLNHKRHIIDWQFKRCSKFTPIVAISNSEVVGFNGVLPVRVRLRGGDIDAHWSCDFFVAAEARRQGIGKALKARLDGRCGLMMALGVSQVGQKALRRLGWKKLAGPRRFVRIMNNGSFRRRLIRLLQRVICGVFNRDFDDGLSVTIVPVNELPLAEEINALCKRVIQDYSACVIRDWEYLNWRYVEAPLGPYSLVLVRNSDALSAIAVISGRGQDVSLVDYLGPRNAPRIKNRIVRRVLEFGSDATTISA